ncbi:TPA: hypothetical protein DD449_02260 [Candidatus Berkelbacteria bacterium]|uniref:PD(D/E)XK endonuclease domain-containing protein n=1 Tax=Berkelbacteria bacterium GW2011_GWE1_39_12 TaxID=1618337 RepID=A0A0G4B3B1_9BACT|nr:MAG: hypothetical protein UT28_C0001G0092 [Berkelbacteria bacterium GW2011_GWE1_39_12]HBO60480.1 hypothetical protein [Candidatus Berkelbacteria bacterium]
MNTKEKGDRAIGQAISHYISQNYEVCLPIGDKRSYDLVVEKGGSLKRVQVKFAGYYPNKDQCLVGLRITGGNQSYHYAKKYEKDDFDELFIYTERGAKYQIPWECVKARSEISIENKKYDEYKISQDTKVVNWGRL